MSFEPSSVRRGLDMLLVCYPHLDVVSVDARFGPWVLVELGQPSEGEIEAYAIWKFAIWRRTGAVHTMSEGAVSDDAIFPVPS